MEKLKEIIAFIVENYPHKHELSNARLTKLVYLSDWYHAIHHKQQISEIDWYFDNYGPFVWDVYKTVENDSDFNVKLTLNMFGNEKKLISLKKGYEPKISNDAKETIETIITKTKSLNWNDFISLVYSTYPILTSEKYSHINLVEKAKERENKK
jgi:uncharacterized phage-associated protein